MLADHDVESELLIIIIYHEFNQTHLSEINSLWYNSDDILVFKTGEKEKSKEKWKDKGNKRKKGPCWICSSDHWKKKCPYERKKKDEKDSSSSNVKSLGISVNTVEKGKDYAFMIEEVLDDEDNISQFEPEKTLNKSWFKREFVKKLENWLDIKELTTKEIVSIVEPTTTWIEFFDLDIPGIIHTRRQKPMRLAQKYIKCRNSI